MKIFFTFNFLSKLKTNNITTCKQIFQNYKFRCATFPKTNFSSAVSTHRCISVNCYTSQEVFDKKFSIMTNENNHLVFLYGTLKRGEPNHELLECRTEGEAIFLGNARSVKKWPLVIASRFNIPYLLYVEGKGQHVIGEIYKVDDIMLAKLDEFECHPSYYTRVKEEVRMISENEEVLKPDIYFLKNFRSELLNLPCLSNYSSKGSHGLEYVSRYERKADENYYSDVMNI